MEKERNKDNWIDELSSEIKFEGKAFYRTDLEDDPAFSDDDFDEGSDDSAAGFVDGSDDSAAGFDEEPDDDSAGFDDEPYRSRGMSRRRNSRTENRPEQEFPEPFEYDNDDEEDYGKPRKSSRKKRPKRKAPVLLLAFIFVLLLSVLAMLFFFNIERITVSGDSYASKAAVTELVFPGNPSPRLLTAVEKVIMGVPEKSVFSKISVRLTGLQSIEIRVTEKQAVLQIEHEGKIWMLDEDAVVLGEKRDGDENVMELSGVTVKEIRELSVLQTADERELKDLGEILRTAKEFGIQMTGVSVSEGEVYLRVGKVRVLVGTTDYLNEKCHVITEQMAYYKNLSGVLHMENYKGEDTDRFFFEVDIEPEEEGKTE